MAEIKLGNVVKCRVTGFQGTVYQWVDFLNGNRMAAVQPRVKEGEVSMPKAINIDTSHLEIIEEGTADLAKPAAETAFQLGDRVQDLGGMEGVITRKITFFNGCIYYEVVPDFDQGSSFLLDDQVGGQVLDQERLTLVSRPKAEKEGKREVTGGPIHESYRV